MVKDRGTVDDDCDACRAGYRNAYPKIVSNRIDVVEIAIKISVEDTGFRFREGGKCWDLISDGAPTPVGSVGDPGSSRTRTRRTFPQFLCVVHNNSMMHSAMHCIEISSVDRCSEESFVGRSLVDSVGGADFVVVIMHHQPPPTAAETDGGPLWQW